LGLGFKIQYIKGCFLFSVFRFWCWLTGYWFEILHVALQTCC